MNENRTLKKESIEELEYLLKGIRSGELKHTQAHYHCGTAHCIAGWHQVLKYEKQNIKYVKLKEEKITRPFSDSYWRYINTDEYGFIDLDRKTCLVDSDGIGEPIPQYYRKSQKKLAKLQKKLSTKKKGSKRRAKAIIKVAKHHKKVANKRKDFHYKIANKLVAKAKFIACEDLNIKGLAKSRLAKSVNDAAWGSFISILKIKAANAGGLVIEVNPNGTSQECSGCGARVSKTLVDRWHSCPHCGLELARDHNSGIVIKNRAIAEGHPVIGVKPKARTKNTRSPRCTARSA